MYHQRFRHRVLVQMSRFISLTDFRARFRVVDPLVAAAQEPHKHYDPFVEKDGSALGANSPS